jgi:hypothetical protein
VRPVTALDGDVGFPEKSQPVSLGFASSGRKPSATGGGGGRQHISTRKLGDRAYLKIAGYLIEQAQAPAVLVLAIRRCESGQAGSRAATGEEVSRFSQLVLEDLMPGLDHCNVKKRVTQS